MPYEVKAECPKCKKKATSYNDVEEEFGWRIVDNEEKIPQSYCRKCR